MLTSSELQFDALREGGGTREAGSTVAESLVVLYRAGTHQIRRRRRAALSSMSQGRAEPLCAIITGLNREVSERKNKSKFLEATNRTKIRKIEIPRSMVVKALSR